MSVVRAVRQLSAIALIGLFTLLPARPASAYLKFGLQVGDSSSVLKWRQAPVRYYVNIQDNAHVTAPEFQTALAHAFSTWQNVPTSSIEYSFVGFTGAQPGQDDGMSTIGFLNEPSLDRVLAATSFMVDSVTGELLESDIFFNEKFTWSVAARGELGFWDVETIALHEIGHLSGLGHSAIGETTVTTNGRRVLSSGAIMFPIAIGAGDVSGRTLDADDIAGISDLYPDGGFTARTGSISGLVLKNGRGVYGAHVVAFNPANGALIANFTLNEDGGFSIAGLSPGPHVLRVEPLDDAEIESFFDDDGRVDIDFRVRYFERLVVVPRGGDSGLVRIEVVPK